METTVTNKFNIAWDKFINKFFNSHNYSTRRKFYNSAWSILLGILITIIIISAFGYNPFVVLFSFIQDTNVFGDFVPILVTFILSGLSVAICFKAGIFNIGIPGQMMSAGFISLLLIRGEIANSGGSFNHGTVIGAILLSILISVCVALLIGVLKAYLNVNEVVSSIMINWIIFFIIRYFVGLYQNDSGFHLTTNELFGYSKSISYATEMPDFYFIDSWYSSGWSWILIIFTALITLTIWMLIKFTKFGYKIKMVGLSSTAADYSGTNKKHLILATMSISGLLSGLAGFVWYFAYQKGTIDISISNGPLYIGFTAIAISLIVFDNPLAILLSSYIFSVIYIGTDTAISFPVLPNEMTDIISGVFIYSAALAFVFTKFLPYQWIRNFIILVKNPEYRKVYWKNWWEFFNYHFSWFKEKKELFNLWKSNHEIWNDIKKHIKNKQKEEINLLIGPNKKVNFKKMDNETQIQYLELLSRMKKEKELLLSQEHYFDVYKIKAKRKEVYSSWKHEYNALKTKIIKMHLKIVEEKIHDTTNEIVAKEKELLDKKNKKGGK
ncbi:MAG: hypothetical protein HDR43_02210 [Mycoplasma sp.]|nr:hypothetical protein [Mycoplasma sp.]